jgi:hypothetical protein
LRFWICDFGFAILDLRFWIKQSLSCLLFSVFINTLTWQNRSSLILDGINYINTSSAS